MTKSAFVGIRFTPDERAHLERLAALTGGTASEVVRRLVRGTRVRLEAEPLTVGNVEGVAKDSKAQRDALAVPS